MKNILTLIIGKSSNLSINLNKNIDHSLLISTLNPINELNLIIFENYSAINIIFNQFQKSTMLYSFDNPTEYIQRSISSTAAILTYIKSKAIPINKIIYTSSSSVYGNNPNCHEYDDTNPKSLHSSLKVSNEKIIELFSIENNINYTIARIFNMYGGEDTFSIIQKIFHSYKKDSTLQLINNGEAIRDFIYIEDVVNIYLKLLNKKNIPIINLGTGVGKSVLFILDYLRRNNIIINTSTITKSELMVSISNNRLLLDFIGNYQFTNIEDYILNKIQNSEN